jgi:hypothetical protein
MAMDQADDLILRLAGGLRPVKRLRPPGRRAALWLAVFAILAGGFVAAFANLDRLMERAQDPKVALELIGTVLTGITAVTAAFLVSLPDRSPLWSLLPAPAFLLWVGSSGYNCWSRWAERGPEGWRVGESAGCFSWIVVVSLPLAVGLLIPLRRARPLSPGLVAAMAGLGVASLAAFLLQFFHPFDVTFMDLGLHLAGVATVVFIAEAAARRTLTDERARR